MTDYFSDLCQGGQVLPDPYIELDAACIYDLLLLFA
jgi:hypothetical protein